MDARDASGPIRLSLRRDTCVLRKHCVLSAGVLPKLGCLFFRTCTKGTDMETAIEPVMEAAKVAALTLKLHEELKTCIFPTRGSCIHSAPYARSQRQTPPKPTDPHHAPDHARGYQRCRSTLHARATHTHTHTNTHKHKHTQHTKTRTHTN